MQAAQKNKQSPPVKILNKAISCGGEKERKNKEKVVGVYLLPTSGVGGGFGNKLNKARGGIQIEWQQNVKTKISLQYIWVFPSKLASLPRANLINEFARQVSRYYPLK